MAIVNPKWLALVAGLLALNVTARAQQSTRILPIGLLTGQSQASSASGPNIDAFRQGLREFGYIAGKNIVVEYRGAGGKLDRMPELAAELVALGVDIIVTTGMPPGHCCQARDQHDTHCHGQCR
jgi:putative ABC transport system substrate-binding protein